MLAWMGGKRKKFELWKKAKTNGSRGSNDKEFATGGFSEQYNRLASLSGIPESSPKNKSRPSRTRSLGARSYHAYAPMIEEDESGDSEELERQVRCTEVAEVSNAVRPPADFFSPDSIDDERLDASAMHSFPQSESLVGAKVAPTDPAMMSDESRSKDRALIAKKRPKLILKKRARSAPFLGRSLDLCMISMNDLD